MLVFLKFLYIFVNRSHKWFFSQIFDQYLLKWFSLNTYLLVTIWNKTLAFHTYFLLLQKSKICVFSHLFTPINKQHNFCLFKLVLFISKINKMFGCLHLLILFNKKEIVCLFSFSQHLIHINTLKSHDIYFFTLIKLTVKVFLFILLQYNTLFDRIYRPTTGSHNLIRCC